MTEAEPQKSIQDKVLSAIKNGQVTMRPKWHFVLRAALLVVGIVLVSLVVLYLCSFIIFMLHQNGAWFVPAFGMRGMREFLVSLPWLLIVIAAVFIGLLELMVRHYALSYRKPLLYSVLGIVGLVALGSVAIAATPLHSQLFVRSRQGDMPIAGGLYSGFGMNHANHISPCRITKIVSKGYEAQCLPEDETVIIVVTPQTRFPLGEDLESGDDIIVIGERDDGTISAFGIREVSGSMKPIHHRRMMMNPLR